MRILYSYIIISLMLLSFFNCSKDDNSLGKEPESEEKSTPKYNYTSQAQKNLNVVYFVPTDVQSRNDSHRRVSEVLLHGQAFFRKYMKEYGFGNKSYNMLVDETAKRVKIIYVKGKNPASYYPYEGGGAKIIKEVDAYFTSHPDEKNSDHTFVLTPVVDPKNSDAPFYGYGRYCFAVDFDDMDVEHFGESGIKGENATIYIGGLLHELGHGLNLPHNKEKVSDFKSATKGTALMGSGNYTYGSKPTFLTKASCAILNNCQVISDYNGTFYAEPSLKISAISGAYTNGELKISGTFETDKEVNYVCFYNDPATDNADYDAVSWASPVKTGNGFEIGMPVNELHKKENTPYILRLLFCHTNGSISRYSYAYTMKNGNPVIEFGNKENFDRSKWTVIDFSSEESTDKVSAMLDGNGKTFWHSRWIQNPTTYPHYFTIDMGEKLEVTGFSFLQRDGMRKVKDIEILVSNSSDNSEWKSMGNYELKEVNTLYHIFLPNKTSFRYFKVIAKSAFDGQAFAAMAEVMCF